ncbi:hypothetical protein CYMTET_14465 [Cymbomonas tetramitiformis]|uniref:Cyclic nucleotide-binding domain-containing protein n=1 Tax=Cymbomonas tetramitiformis TaxID=36881 RepID=A0AAE0GGB2_9CHLO|nr:hypothetical protein CYMTET_14465 [Cymbomonas tetramitiformis]
MVVLDAYQQMLAKTKRSNLVAMDVTGSIGNFNPNLQEVGPFTLALNDHQKRRLPIASTPEELDVEEMTHLREMLGLHNVDGFEDDEGIEQEPLAQLESTMKASAAIVLLEQVQNTSRYFYGFDAIELQVLAEVFTKLLLVPGTPVMRKGDAPTFVAVVLGGVVDLLDSSGEKIESACHGAVLGARELFHGMQRALDAVCNPTEPTMLLVITFKQLILMNNRYPLLGVKLMRMFCKSSLFQMSEWLADHVEPESARTLEETPCTRCTTLRTLCDSCLQSRVSQLKAAHKLGRKHKEQQPPKGLFPAITDDDLTLLAKRLTLCRYNACDLVLEQGDVATCMFFCLAGSVDVRIGGLGGKVVATKGVGEYVGEFAFVSSTYGNPPATRSASIYANALDGCVLGMITNEQLVKLNIDQPLLGFKVALRLGELVTLALRIQVRNMDQQLTKRSSDPEAPRRRGKRREQVEVQPGSLMQVLLEKFELSTKGKAAGGKRMSTKKSVFSRVPNPRLSIAGTLSEGPGVATDKAAAEDLGSVRDAVMDYITLEVGRRSDMETLQIYQRRSGRDKLGTLLEGLSKTSSTVENLLKPPHEDPLAVYTDDGKEVDEEEEEYDGEAGMIPLLVVAAADMDRCGVIAHRCSQRLNTLATKVEEQNNMCREQALRNIQVSEQMALVKQENEEFQQAGRFRLHQNSGDQTSQLQQAQVQLQERVQPGSAREKLALSLDVSANTAMGGNMVCAVPERLLQQFVETTHSATRRVEELEGQLVNQEEASKGHQQIQDEALAKVKKLEAKVGELSQSLRNVGADMEAARRQASLFHVALDRILELESSFGQLMKTTRANKYTELTEELEMYKANQHADWKCAQPEACWPESSPSPRVLRTTGAGFRTINLPTPPPYSIVPPSPRSQMIEEALQDGRPLTARARMVTTSTNTTGAPPSLGAFLAKQDQEADDVEEKRFRHQGYCWTPMPVDIPSRDPKNSQAIGGDMLDGNVQDPSVPTWNAKHPQQLQKKSLSSPRTSRDSRRSPDAIRVRESLLLDWEELKKIDSSNEKEMRARRAKLLEQKKKSAQADGRMIR